MPFQYSRESRRTPAEAISSVEEALSARRFSVLWNLDMSDTLAQKGFAGHQEAHILEVCNAARADEALRMAPDIAYLLPCKMVVRAKGQGSEIGLLRPSALIALTGSESGDLAAFAAEVEEDLRAVVDEAAD